jgi:peroxiredoxin
MSLQEKLDAFRANFESGGAPYHAPAHIHEIMHRATDELIASRAADSALKVGATAPDFSLKNAEGQTITSAELLRSGPLIITFYRGVWCPYCNMDLQALQAALPEFQKRGAQLLAISPQTASNSRRSQRENNLNFPILSDPHNEVAAQFGLRFTLPDYLQELYKNLFKNDLAIVNGDASWTLPMPARFLIAKNRTVLYAEVNPDYTRRPDPEALLPVLDEVSRAAA